MSDNEEILEPEGGSDLGTVTLMLGLYLIVLAFFILLNAISQDSQDRHEMVVESVREGFDFREEGDNVGSDDTELTVIPLYQASTQDIEGVIHSYIPFDDLDIERSSERLFVSMNLRRFFRPGALTIIPEMILFFEDLASVLKDPRPGISIKTEIVVRGDKTEVVKNINKNPLEISGLRSALFARALIDEGVDPTSISAGAVEDDPRIIIVFDLYISDYERAITEAMRLKDVLQSAQDGSIGGGASSSDNPSVKSPQ